MMTLPEKLSREVERVTVMRERLYDAAVERRRINPKDDVADLKLVIKTMNAAIEAAHKAAGEGDASSIVAAVVPLGRFKEAWEAGRTP